MPPVNGPQSLNSYIKSVCDIMRRANCAGALQYVPELTWMLFLRILDEREEEEAASARAVGAPFTPSLGAPYRWRDWAARNGPTRAELTGAGSTLGDFMKFVDNELIANLRNLKDQPGANPRQKVVSEVFSNVERSRIDTERNLLDIIDKLDDLQPGSVDDTHVFTLSQVYEGLLLKMGEKNNDGGQFFTPREVIRAMVRTVDPRVGETVYDPGCGTGYVDPADVVAPINGHGQPQVIGNTGHSATVPGGGSPTRSCYPVVGRVVVGWPSVDRRVVTVG